MKLKVVSFNIRFCDDPNGHSIAERAPRLSKVVNALDPDIIGFQEYRPQWESYIEKDFLDRYGFFNKYRNTTVDIESSPILWRKDKFKCLKTGYFWLSDTPTVESKGWDELCDCYRMCVYAILSSTETGKTFTVMNTHFGFGDRGQVAGTELIYRYSRQISDDPTFIVGDFNMTPESPAYRKMTGYFTDVNAVTAKDLRTTYHGYDPENVTNEHIDYCFVNSKIKPVSQRIIDDTVDGKFVSDHYGLEIVMDI